MALSMNDLMSTNLVLQVVTRVEMSTKELTHVQVMEKAALVTQSLRQKDLTMAKHVIQHLTHVEW
jgi:hypothetical protein